MSAVPVIINGVFMPAGRSANDQPIKGTMIGYASIAGLEIGGGPIIPPDVPPVDPPVDPPTDPGPNVVVVVKPAPVTGGWGLATDQSGALKWFFVPVAQPKR
jgi:hypothetical protein